MGDEEAQVRVEYLDVAEGADPEVTNWISRPGKARVTYLDGSVFEGTFDAEKMKQGQGLYIWMTSGGEDEEKKERSRYDGNYKDGKRNGYGVMTFPNGDSYQGEFVDNKFQGTGTYMYKASGDIHSGRWENGVKNGEGIYEFGADSSQFAGLWENGEMKSGQWRFKSAGHYEGGFKGNRPFGPGTFSFPSGLQHTGEYVAVKESEEEGGGGEEEEGKQVNLVWQGKSLVSF